MPACVVMSAVIMHTATPVPCLCVPGHGPAEEEFVRKSGHPQQIPPCLQENRSKVGHLMCVSNMLAPSLDGPSPCGPSQPSRHSLSGCRAGSARSLPPATLATAAPAS